MFFFKKSSKSSSSSSGNNRNNNEEVESKSIPVLLEKYRDKINALKARVAENFLPTRTKLPLHIVLDDITYLRYVLSFKNIKKGAKAFGDMLTWRTENSELIDSVVKGEKHPESAVFEPLIVSDVFELSGQTVIVTQAGLSSPDILMKKVGKKSLLDYLMMQKEKMFRLVDKKTRETSQLTKGIVINELRYFEVILNQSAFNFLMPIADSAKIAEYVYPACVERNVFVNLTSVVSKLWQMAKPFLGNRTKKRISFCLDSSPNGNLSNCPFVQKYLGNRLENLPRFLGGKDLFVGNGSGSLVLRPSFPQFRSLLLVPPKSQRKLQWSICILNEKQGAKVRFVVYGIARDSIKMLETEQADKFCIPPGETLLVSERVISDFAEETEISCGSSGAVLFSIDLEKENPNVLFSLKVN